MSETTTTPKTTKSIVKKTEKKASSKKETPAGLTLRSRQVRILKALAGCKHGALSRKALADEVFNGNNLSFNPLLAPMALNGLVKSETLELTEGVKEEAFTITAKGKKALKDAPPALAIARVRGPGEHKRLPKAGEVITSQYKGKEIKVTVLGDGFRYANKNYPSLSACAKAVRGNSQEVNGWKFFGLTKEPAPSKNGKP